MSGTPNQALGAVSQSSARYAEAVTLLSRTIVEVEERLNAMPGKRAVAVRRSQANPADGLKFDRVKDGKWAIYYDQNPFAQIAAILASGGQGPTLLLRDAPVDVKLNAAPLLPLLLAELASELNKRAEEAESAVASVHSLLAALPKGGA